MPELSKFPSISPKIVADAKIPRVYRFATETYSKFSVWDIHSFSDLTGYIFGKRWINLSLLPVFGVVFLYVRSVIFHKFQVFQSIVGSNVIKMMNTFVLFKFSPDRLFNDVTMMKHPFAIDVDSKIAKPSNRNLSLFKVRPIWRYIVTFMPIESATMHLTYLAARCRQYIYTIFYPTNFAEHILYYNVLEIKVQ